MSDYVRLLSLVWSLSSFSSTKSHLIDQLSLDPSMNHRSNFILDSLNFAHLYDISITRLSLIPLLLRASFFRRFISISFPFQRLFFLFLFFPPFLFFLFVNHNGHVPFARFVCQFRLPLSLFLSLRFKHTAHRRDTMKLEKGGEGRGKLAGINEFVRWRVLHRSNHHFDGIESGCFRLQNGEIRDIVNIVSGRNRSRRIHGDLSIGHVAFDAR